MNFKHFTTNFTTIILLIITLYLSGCAAAQVAIEHRNLDVQTKMSETVFLDPVKDDLKTVYLQIKNTSDKDIDISPLVKTAIESRGYKVISDPDSAHYMMQANILQVGKIDPSAAQQALMNGFGGALLGGTVGALASQGRGNSGMLGAIAGGAIVGGLMDTVTNSMVKNVTFSIISDLQISERSKGVVKQETNSNLTQGTETVVKQTESTESNWKRYRTRILSTANKVNLSFEDALPELEKGLAKSVSGIF